MFTSTRDALPPEVYTMSASGSAVTRLTVNTHLWETRPAFSPDDRQILFTTASPNVLALYVMNADGSNLSRLSSDAVQPYSAAWAPGGREVVFDAVSNGEINLFVAGTGASGERQLTTAGFTLFPYWIK